MQIVKNDQVIETVDDWKKWAAPKGKDKHWKAGRSALECAHAWCGEGSTPAVPQEIIQLLNSHPDTKDCTVETVIPEHRVRFDKLRGEPRNSDVCCLARNALGALAISIEAKADEAFGKLVGEEIQHIAAKIARDENTNGIKRIQQLSQALLPPWKPGDAHLGELRYQLLTGVAGALAYAQEEKAARSVFIIHEFITSETTDKKHAANAVDLNRFMARLTGTPHQDLQARKLFGPFAIPASALFPDAPLLYVGKATTHLRQALV